MDNINIIDAYKMFNNGLVIFISGYSGCGKSVVAKLLSDNTGLSLIDQSDYFIDSYNKSTTITYNDNNVATKNTVINWDSDDAINFDKLNKDINLAKKNGVIVSGHSLGSLIKISPNFHIHIKLSKNQIIENRHKYLQKNKTKYPSEYNLIGSQLEKAIFNKLSYPYYINCRNNSRVNKFVSGDNNTDSQLFDIIWDVLIGFIQNEVNLFAKNKYHDWIKSNPVPSSSSSSSNISSNISSDISSDISSLEESDDASFDDLSNDDSSIDFSDYTSNE